MVCRGSSGRVFGGFHSRCGSHDCGLARGVSEGGEGESGPRGRERREERGALLLSREARFHARLLGGATKAASVVSAPGMTPPLAATASGLDDDGGLPPLYTMVKTCPKLPR